MKHIAIIDIGSNSVRLLFAKITSPLSFKIITELKEYVRLGAGFDEEGNINEEKIISTIRVLNLYKNFCSMFEDTKMIVTATEALRKAKNKNFILTRVKDELNINVRILSGEEEAYYDYFAVINTLNVKDGLIMDIGGASTEIIWVKNRTLKECISLPFGAITLTKKFKLENSISSEQEKLLNDFLFENFSKVSWLKNLDSSTLIGIGGSIRNLGKISRKKKNHPLNLIHNYTMSSKCVEDIYDEVKIKTNEQRRKIKGLSKDRSDIFVGAAGTVKSIITLCKIKKLTICRNGIREGLLLSELFNKKPIENILDFSISNVLMNNNVNINHSKHVYKLTNLLFSSLKPVHKITENLDNVIKTSAMFHDVGINISYYYYHKHSAYIILNSSLYGISHKECVISACIAVYQRSQSIQLMLDKYKNLINKSDIHKIKVIGLFLRIAENLDKDLSGAIESLNCTINDDTVIIKTYSKHSCEFLIREAQTSSELFKNIFNKSLYIV